MRWWHALILALGLVIGGALSGGLYEVRLYDGDHPIRFNRFTGAIDGYMVNKDGMGWFRLPNHEYRAVSAPKSVLDEAFEDIRRQSPAPER
jgi:hypothetical protein